MPTLKQSAYIILAALGGLAGSFIVRIIFAFAMIPISKLLTSLAVQEVIFWGLQLIATIFILFLLSKKPKTGLWLTIGYGLGAILSLGIGPM